MRLFFCTSLLLASTLAFPKHDPRDQPWNDTATTGPNAVTRIRLNPTAVRNLSDSDYVTWTIPNAAKADFKNSGNGSSLSFSLSTASGTLGGNSYKAVYTCVIASLGERVIAEGISTKTDAGDDVGGVAVTLTISGLSAGEHSILAWHNAWDKLKATAN